MAVCAPGWTMKRPPHRPVATPLSRASAARRSDPGVWAVPILNWEGLTIRIGANVLMTLTAQYLSTLDKDRRHDRSRWRSNYRAICRRICPVRDVELLQTPVAHQPSDAARRRLPRTVVPNL